MQRCAYCDQEYADDLADCPNCGGEAAEIFRCDRCQEQVRGSDACPACGFLRREALCAVHPEREAAGRCVVCGQALCDGCAARERPAFLCEDHRGVKVIEGWTQVYSTTNEFEGSLIRENLRAEGIEAQIFSQRDNIFSVDLGELSIVRILVPVTEYERALSVIRAHMDAGGEVVFACPACGEPYDAGSAECASCGAPLQEAR